MSTCVSWMSEMGSPFTFFRHVVTDQALSTRWWNRRWIRLNTECSSCQGPGRITPDIALVSRKFGADVRSKVEKAIDELLRQTAELTYSMRELVHLMSE